MTYTEFKDKLARVLAVKERKTWLDFSVQEDQALHDIYTSIEEDAYAKGYDAGEADYAKMQDEQEDTYL